MVSLAMGFTRLHPSHRPTVADGFNEIANAGVLSNTLCSPTCNTCDALILRLAAASLQHLRLLGNMTLMNLRNTTANRAGVATIFRNLTIPEKPPLAPWSRIIGSGREWDKIDCGHRAAPLGGEEGLGGEGDHAKTQRKSFQFSVFSFPLKAEN